MDRKKQMVENNDINGENQSKPDLNADMIQRQTEITSKDYYFDSYAHFAIHEEMLKDTVRTSSYRSAILHNKYMFEGKIVLDVGCGTGILSMFAAKAGARKVYAVDFSTIANEAKQIIADNKLDHIIEVRKCKVEDLKIEEKVDIIISEWMGYFLLYESMLDTVLYARDHFLKPEGKILPNKSSMYICGIEDGEYKEEKINFWDNVYGFDMSCMKKIALLEPLVETVESKYICTSSDRLLEFDIDTMANESVDFEASFEITFTQNDYCHALVVYFDVDFDQGHKPVSFSTGPQSQYTHWKQTIFYLPEEVIGCEGEVLRGTMSCKRNKNNKRDLDIQLSYKFRGQRYAAEKSAFYRLR